MNEPPREIRGPLDPQRFERDPEREAREARENGSDLFRDERDPDRQYEDAVQSSRKLGQEQESGGGSPEDGGVPDGQEHPGEGEGEGGVVLDDGIFGVKVPVYEGPMDLLLYVVRQRQVDLLELPLSPIASDFLAYARAVEELDLDASGEIIYIAAILLRMKVRALLPVEEEEEVEDPEKVAERDEELEEVYREIVAAARKLAAGEEVQRNYFRRGEAGGKPEMDTTDELMRNVSIVNLAEAFRQVTRKMEKSTVQQLRLFKVTVEDQSAAILKGLEHRERIGFAEIVEPMSERIEAVIAFLALLELMRFGRIRVQQEGLFGAIWITRGARFGEASMSDINSEGDVPGGAGPLGPEE